MEPPCLCSAASHLHELRVRLRIGKELNRKQRAPRELLLNHLKHSPFFSLPLASLPSRASGKSEQASAREKAQGKQWDRFQDHCCCCCCWLQLSSTASGGEEKEASKSISLRTIRRFKCDSTEIIERGESVAKSVQQITKGRLLNLCQCAHTNTQLVALLCCNLTAQSGEQTEQNGHKRLLHSRPSRASAGWQ